MNKSIIGAIIIVLVGAVAWYVISGKDEVTPQTSDTATQGKVVYTWKTAAMPEQDGVPRTSVTLVVGDKSYALGEFSGSCSEIDGTSWTLVEGEKTGVICWYAGGGNELAIFEENGKAVVKQGDLDEGSAETPGMRGNFRTVLAL